MLAYPAQTSREDKLKFVHLVKEKYLQRYQEAIMAIGVYGSLGKGTEGPFSDIEMHVITDNNTDIVEHELIFEPYKLEISVHTVDQIFAKAKRVDDMWPIRSGSYIHILALYDPQGVFAKLSQIPMQVTQEQLYDVMKVFMIWEPYETMGKLRNARLQQDWDYITLGAMDIAWKTAKLIGLANKRYFTTRVKTFAESLEMVSQPQGYRELVSCVMAGDLTNREKVYQLCENLWTGLNEWFEELGIEYKSKELPPF